MLQHQMIDVQAMLVVLTACLVPPLPRLNKHKPAFRLCTLPALAILTMNAVGLLILDISYMALLLTRPWYDGGTGGAYLVSPVLLHHHHVTSGLLSMPRQIWLPACTTLCFVACVAHDKSPERHCQASSAHPTVCT